MKASLLKLILSALLWLCVCFTTNAQCTIVGNTNASSLSCGSGSLTSCNGIVYIGDGTTVMTLTMDAALNLTCLGTVQVIVRNNATMYFSPGNDYLTLSEGSSITFLPGSNLVGGSCNASERIYIGGNLLASCNGQAGADMSFADLLFFGGTGSASSNSPVCLGGTITLTATPPPYGTFIYSWSGPGLASTPYSSSPNYSLTATGSTGGTYQVKMKGTIGSTTKTAIAEASVTVTPLSTPVVGTITQPDCSTSTGSVSLSGLPSSGTWTIVQTGTVNTSYTGSGTSTTISGLQLGTFAFKVTTSGGCTSLATSNIVITPTSGTIWNGSSWSNGTPTAAKNIVFNGNYSGNGNLVGCSCQVQSGTVVIKSGYSLTLDKALTVLNGSLTISDNASLVQVDDNAVNSGNIILNRIANIKKFDYVYWSSPLANFPITSLSPSTLSVHLWKWIPTIGGNYGNWTNANENMIAGKGYLVRGPSNFDNVATQKFTATFTGTPNNGLITPAIERGSYQGADYQNPNGGGTVTSRDDNYNLLGNPYPSSIKALDFLTANPTLEGAVRIWTHGSLPSASNPSPFYGYFQYNYSMNDYIVYNGTGTISGPSGFNGYIASGQAFFVTMVDGPATTGNAIFKNSMRSSAYDNSQFYRFQNSDGGQYQNEASGRIWLDLVAGNGSVSRTLVGYLDGATNAKDRMYDADIKLGAGQNFYSMIDDRKMCIQGKALPFSKSDRVDLGFQTTTEGTYNLAIATLDGFFENDDRPIFVKDNLLGLIHDLKQAPYRFSTAAGTFNNRFTLLYAPEAAGKFGVVTQETVAGNIILTEKNAELAITASDGIIDKVSIYDLTGRKIYDRDGINNNQFSIDNLRATQQILIVKTTLTNGQVFSKRTIF